MSFGMIGYVVPHSIYPDDYHCDPQIPLPFMNIASQKNFVGIYHIGIYSNEKINTCFMQEWPKHSKRKLDMGKSCIRLKEIPYDLIGELATKMIPKAWVDIYETSVKKK